MAPSEQSIDDLLDAILDGTPADWTTADSSPGASPTLVRQLRVLAAVAELHRGAPSATPGDVPATLQASTASETPLLGGHLRLFERIGRGAFGEVYRAWDCRLDREVALKLLPASSGAQDRSPSSLIQEGRLLARVRHPNVVTIYGAEPIDERIALWMEFVRGQTLEQMLEQRQVLNASETVTIGLELSQAIAAVHGAGLLHRDIKTHNVMRSDDGRIVLMDFGAGRDLDDEASSDLAGTPLYLAPEVLNGQHATVRSDIYSLGVLLYHLVTGSYPVHARTVRGVRGAHERGERAAVRSARRGVPRRLADIIERATDPCAERRYPDVEALRTDLLRLQPRRRTTRLAYAAAYAAAFLLVVLLGWEVADHRVGRSWRPVALLAGFGALNDSRENGSADLEAYDLYLQARALIDRRGIPNAHKAAELFQRAIARDPEFAPAHAGLATAYAFMSFPYRGISFDTAFPIMQPAALNALRLDPALAEAHAAMGWVYAYKHDWVNAARSFQRSIELDPSLTQAYTSYSISTLLPLEKFGEALQLLHEALRRDPLSLDVQREIGLVQLFSGQYADAVATFERVSELQPDFPFVHTYLARALTLTGRTEEAFPLLEPGVPYLALTYVSSGRRPEAERLAAEWERYPFRLAVIAAALGDRERTLVALEHAAISEPHRMGRLFIEPEFAALRGDPRFSALRRKFGLR